jgi:hypothetical protein
MPKHTTVERKAKKRVVKKTKVRKIKPSVKRKGRK